MNLGRYAVAFADLDGELFQEIFDSENELRAGQMFLFAHSPEAEAEIAGLNTFAELNEWCTRCGTAMIVTSLA